MRKIKLTRGKVVIVDNWNYDWLNQFKWHAIKGTSGIWYAIWNDYTTGKCRTIYMHRLILGLKQNDGKMTDHVNHNGLDNREFNIRVITHQQNCFNKKNPKGCYWNKQTKKWKAQIGFNGKYYHLGMFTNEKNAHEAYIKAKKKYHKIVI